MRATVSNILDYTPPPDEADIRRKSRLLLAFVLISFTMMIVGYVILAMKLL